MDGMRNDQSASVRRKFDVGEYHRMADAGIFREGERVELIDGEIISMSPASSLHSGRIDRIASILRSAFGNRALIRSQMPVRLGRFAEPEPDISVTTPNEGFFESGHPTSDDILLLVEVSISSVVQDRIIKTSLNARHGIAEYWIVDLTAGELVRCREPNEIDYRDVAILGPTDAISPLAAPDLRIELSSILQRP